VTLVAALDDSDASVADAANAALEKRSGRIVAPSGVMSLDAAARKDVARQWSERLAGSPR
jgi:hypothetical protein